MTQSFLQTLPYRYRAVIEWIDDETGEPRRHEGEFLEISVGKAGRLMSTMTDGESLNFKAFTAMRIEQIAPDELG